MTIDRYETWRQPHVRQRIPNKWRCPFCKNRMAVEWWNEERSDKPTFIQTRSRISGIIPTMALSAVRHTSGSWMMKEQSWAIDPHLSRMRVLGFWMDSIQLIFSRTLGDAHKKILCKDSDFSVVPVPLHLRRRSTISILLHVSRPYAFETKPILNASDMNIYVYI